MRKVAASSFVFLLAACATKPAAEPTPLSIASAPAPAASAPASASTATAKAPPPAHDAEAEKAEKLAKARAKVDSDHQAELARWTPELHATAKRLAEASYPTTDAALKAALASPIRQPGNADRDKYRHPRETLEFFGVQPTSTVLEYGPGGGWYTELLAPTLAKRGKLLVTTDDPNGPLSERSIGAQRLKLVFETSPELFGKVEPVGIDAANPKLPFDDKLDVVLVIRELHNLVNDGSIDAWLKEFKHALKPHGVLAIEDHRAAVGADPAQSSKLGYLPEAWAIQKIEAAGFKLAGKSEINANPKDTKDYPDGVWTLPPTYRLGDKDREKYAAIGESDRFTLRFVRNDAPAAPVAPAKPAAPAKKP